MIEVLGQGDNDIVLQKVLHQDGSLIRYQFGVPGDAANMKECTLEEGKQAIIRTTYTIVDRVKYDNGTYGVVRKATRGRRVAYEYAINGNVFSPVPTLAEARKAIGK